MITIIKNGITVIHPIQPNPWMDRIHVQLWVQRLTTTLFSSKLRWIWAQTERLYVWRLSGQKTCFLGATPCSALDNCVTHDIVAARLTSGALISMNEERMRTCFYFRF